MNQVFNVGDRVRTTASPLVEPDGYERDIRASNQWHQEGWVHKISDSHGVCYQVRHPNGGMGWYEPQELHYFIPIIDKLDHLKFDDEAIRKTIQNPGPINKHDQAFFETLLIGAVFGGFTLLVVLHLFGFLHIGVGEDYLRRHIIRVGTYTPCQDKFFDAAMGVDCGIVLKEKAK